jgi:hypothetical protein
LTRRRLAGGQRITHPGDEARFLSQCTSAFVGYNARSVALQTVKDYYLITPGHCGGDASRPWSQSGDNPALGAFPIGTNDRNTYVGTTAADSQRIPIHRQDSRARRDEHG